MDSLPYVLEDRGYRTPCWVWQRSQTRGGYGQIKVRQKNWRAHRYFYEQARGPVPVGLDLDHLCRVRLCVNPDHLEPVTRRENLRRGNTPVARADGQTHCKRGHELAGDNLGINAGRYRFCRTCKRMTDARLARRRSRSSS